MQIPLWRLDAISLAYLRNAEKNAHSSSAGVFVPRRFLLLRYHAQSLALGAAAMLAGFAAVWLSRTGLPGRLGVGISASIQATLTAIAFLLLFWMVRRIVRRARLRLGTFLYADPRHLWDVGAADVHVFFREDISAVEHEPPHISLLFPFGTDRIHVRDEQMADKLVRYLERPPRGRLADALESLPAPAEIPAVPRTGLSRLLAGPWPWLATAATVGLMGFAGFWLLDGAALDDSVFAQAVEAAEPEALEDYVTRFPTGRHVEEARALADDGYFARAKQRESLALLTDYLARYPAGRHVSDAPALRDDIRFHLALRGTQKSDNPTEVRGYLSDKANTRHRDEAWQEVARCYDKAIAGVRERARKQRVDPDGELLHGLIALLESLKRAESPVVTLAFKATHKPAPTTDEIKAKEKRMYEFYMKNEPGVAKAAAEAERDTALLDAGPVFDANFVAHRERFMRKLLSAGLSPAFAAGLLTLRPAADGEAAMIEVSYRVAPNGLLYPASFTNAFSPDGPPDNDKADKKIIGLIRDYEMHATIAIRPPGDPRIYQQSVKVEPANVTCLVQGEKQYWGLYAALLYSQGHELARHLLTQFALEPPSALSRVQLSETLPGQ